MEAINLFCLSTEVKQGKTINETRPFETRIRVSHIWIKAKLKLEQQSIRPHLFSRSRNSKRTMPCDFSQSFLKLHWNKRILHKLFTRQKSSTPFRDLTTCRPPLRRF